MSLHRKSDVDVYDKLDEMVEEMCIDTCSKEDVPIIGLRVGDRYAKITYYNKEVVYISISDMVDVRGNKYYYKSDLSLIGEDGFLKATFNRRTICRLTIFN